MDSLLSLLVFEPAIERYATAIKYLKPGIEAGEVLEILSARDTVQALLKAESDPPTSVLSRVIELDDVLREKAKYFNCFVKGHQFSHWRESVNPPAESWWWRLDQSVTHPLNRLDGVWKLMMIAGWTGNIALLVNLAARFLGGGVGLTGVAAIALPSILALLQAGSEFTKTGQASFDKLLGALKIPQQLREEVKLVLTLGMTSMLWAVWSHLPEFSTHYNRSGMASYREGKLGQAEQQFLQAISLHKDNADAHYNLGSLYEELQQPDQAAKEYLIAIAAGLPDAHNNLALLYLKDKKYAQAAVLLNQGIDKFKQDSQNPEVKYSLFKNLGWVRLEQGRYEEAQQLLNIAIAQVENPATAKSIERPATAYCLMAQVLDKQKQPSRQRWLKCQELGSTFDPDEDLWLFQAQQKLKKSK